MYTAGGPVVAYATVSKARKGEWTYTQAPGSPDSRLRYTVDQLRAISQEFYESNSLYRAMTHRVCDVILGESGLTLRPMTADPAVNAELLRRWNQHCQAPEVRGLDNETALERQTLIQLFVDGDILQLKLRDEKQVQVIDADLIGNRAVGPSDKGRRVDMGVELDAYNRPTAFYVDEYDAAGNLTNQPRRIDARDCIFIANRERIRQTRGVPVQQSNFAMYHRINDVCDSEAIAWQLLSRFAIAITRDDASELAEATSTEDTYATDDDMTKRVHQIADAMIFHGKSGESIAGVKRDVPGANFSESLKMFMRLLGLPFGFSLEFVLLIWSDTTFSSGRASKVQVERSVKPWIAKLKEAKSARYRWLVARWVEEGAIPPRADAFDHEWVPEPYPFLDPMKEREAERTELECGLSSHTEIAKRHGGDDGLLVKTLEEDWTRRAEAARRLNVAFPDEKFSARDFTAMGAKSKAVAAPAPQAPLSEPKPQPEEAQESTDEDQ